MREITLRGVLPKTTTWVRILPGGVLEVELYDFSDQAESCLGGDVAFLLRVSEKDRGGMQERLFAELGTTPEGDLDAALLSAVERRFSDYYGIKAWLEQTGVPFESEFEPNA